MADGNITVIGHESQKNTLSTSHTQIEEVLSSTAHKGDGLLACKVVDSHLGDRRGEVHQIHERELAEQEVHGSVEPWVSTNEENGEGIATHSNKEDHHSQGEKKDMSEGVIKESFQKEVGQQGLIALPHGLPSVSVGKEVAVNEC